MRKMLTYTYISKGKFGLVEKPKPTIQHERDAIVKVTLASIPIRSQGATRRMSCLKINATELLRSRWSVKRNREVRI